MRNFVVIVALVTVTSSGCYLGRTATQKRHAVAIDGVMMATGVVALALQSHYYPGTPAGCSSDACEAPYPGPGAIGLGIVGAGLLLAGVIGLVANASTPTVPDPAPAKTAMTASVTAPGLRPAVITLR
ncbi:MAG TPA: hypothetical protein VGM90_03565 [Kofleriaceae bacterium]|jgi:dipeptide/tripeptide permease